MGWSDDRTHSDVLVVVPTYDEAGNIDRLLDEVGRALPGAHVLVVDDASPDGTGDLVRARPELGDSLFLLARPAKAGLGAAYRAGFGWALDRDYEAVVQMDADLSHPPGRLPALVAALDDADIAVGSRYVAGGAVRNWAWHRRLLSRAGNLYVRLVLGLGIHDATAGFKAFRREALLAVGAAESTAEGYGFQIENAWRARRGGLRVVEVPITFTDRTVGTSKMSGSIIREAVIGAPSWRLRELYRHHRDLPAFLAVGAAGYVVDVVVFNLLRGSAELPSADPTLARTAAIVPAMAVTYLGNRLVTWRGRSGSDRTDIGRQLCLFIVFNAIGLGLSAMTLAVSHDLLGLTSRLADNISANVVGLALGTAFRYLTYRRYVFTRPTGTPITTLTEWTETPGPDSRVTSSSSTTRNGSSRSSATTSAP